MAFVSYVDIDPAQEQQFYSVLTPDSQFLYSKVKKKTGLFSAKKKKSLLLRSFLPQIAEAWNALSVAEQTAWTTAGSYCNLNGYRCFVAESSVRLKLDLTIPNTPSNYHQAWYGHLNISAPAQQIKITQPHPASYYIHHLVPGGGGLYEPKLIEEPMSLPLQIGLSYKCILSATGASQIAKYYAVVRSSYQGVDRENVVEINLNLDGNWHTETATLTTTLGYFTSYSLYFHIYGYTGDVYFDNIKSIHSAVNWARDARCYDVNVAFNNQYYQIPKSWVALELPAGSAYDSDYIDGN